MLSAAGSRGRKRGTGLRCAAAVLAGGEDDIDMCTSFRDDNGEFYVLVGIVSGNPIGCTDSRVYPDYFTYIGHQNVSGNNY